MLPRPVSFPFAAVATIGAIALTEQALVIRPELADNPARLAAVVAYVLTAWLSAGAWCWLASRS